jgi:hypothetical protein
MVQADMVQAHRPTAVGLPITARLGPITVRRTTITGTGPDTITVQDGATTIGPIDRKGSR